MTFTLYLWEKKPAFAGNMAWKATSPLLLELLRLTVDKDEPRPLAMTVPLIRTFGRSQGTTVTRPLTSEIERAL